jgi:hypothetical protein
MDAKQEALTALGEAETSLSKLLEIHRRLQAATIEVERLFVESSKLLADTVKAVESQRSQADLLKAARQTEKTQLSFNRLHLQLHDQIHADNLVFTSVSNVLKTRHDTAKNSISNIH